MNIEEVDKRTEMSLEALAAAGRTRMAIIPGQTMRVRFDAFPMTDLIVPATELMATRQVLAGRFDYAPFPKEPDPRRILDFGAGVGAFAAWAFHRWPYAWIECIELDEKKRAVLPLNAPPGARIHAHDIIEQAARESMMFPEAAGIAPPPGKIYSKPGRAITDVLHCSPDVDPQGLAIDFARLQVAVIEVESTERFVSVAKFFSEIGMKLLAADAGFQTWVRA